MGAERYIHCPKCGQIGEPDGLAVYENIHFECGTTETSPLEMVVELEFACGNEECDFGFQVKHRHVVGQRSEFEFPDEEQALDEDDEDRESSYLAALDMSEGISRR